MTDTTENTDTENSIEDFVPNFADEDTILGDIADDIPDNPFNVAAGTHRMIIVQSEKVDKKDGSGSGWAIKYQVTDQEDPDFGNFQQEWKDFYPRQQGESVEDYRNRIKTNPKIRRAMSFIKMRMNDFGVPESEVGKAKFNNFLGLEFYVTIKESPGTDKNSGQDRVYLKIAKVEPVDDEGSFSY